MTYQAQEKRNGKSSTGAKQFMSKLTGVVVVVVAMASTGNRGGAACISLRLSFSTSPPVAGPT